MKILTPNQQLALAIKIAAEGHLHQVDKGGKPYILHPIKVMHYLKTDDMELMAIGVLHDVVDDCDVTLQDLRDQGFSERVVTGVWLLSNIENIPYEEYIERMLDNEDAMRIKLADLRHNTDVRRLKGLTQKDFERMEKYHTAYKKIKGKLNESTEFIC